MKLILVFAFTLCISCNRVHENWCGRGIFEEGDYSCKANRIIVEDDGHVKYTMLDVDGDTLVRNQRSFSSFHKWALHLDSNMNLWVFSSDIGSFVWYKDVNTGLYYKTHENRKFHVDSIPTDVLNTAKLLYRDNLHKSVNM